MAIIGAGFGGLGLGIRLKQAGIDSFTILERADGVGGVWRHNSYPGLTCDVPSHLYSFSFEPKHDWSRRYPRRDEILAYLEACATKYELADHIRLGTEVIGAEFDSAAAVWRLELEAGERIEADVLVPATGQLSRPVYPDIPGIDGFEGKLFHSARWDHDYDLDGKRVAVIGTGASAIQFVPEIAPRVERLHLFQRSAPWVMRKPDRPYRPGERELYRRAPWLQRLNRFRIHVVFELLTLLFTRARWLERPFERAYRRRLRSQVPDSDLQARLVPDHALGCKRLLISNEWLPTLARSNVEVVTAPIERITEGGVVAEDGERQVDAIILATGFAATDFLAPMAITGLDGRDLNDVWGEGAEAYLGLTVSGFPNMFILYGPNTNLGSGSIVHMLESQIHYVLGAIQELRRTGARYMDVRDEVQRQFNTEMQRRLATSVWASGCSSWYVTESGRVTNNWPGFQLEYRRRTRRVDPADYTIATGA